jgi:adenosylcobinamide kinase/adenosylcobinamide-phosphate guanylyltransferase
MALTLLLGGARSGKSAMAVRRARAFPGPVVCIATAEPRDRDMQRRIARHREGRPPGWSTVEAPLELAGALAAAPERACVIVDCLTLWVANLLEREESDEAIARRAAEAGGLAAQRPAPTIAVTNEVGMGVVPAHELGRRYRDTLGGANSIWAALAEEAFLVVAGRLLPLGQDDAP